MSAGAPSATAEPTLRRLIVYGLLFALVTIAAIGVAGLLGRLLTLRAELVTGDVQGLARSLAFTLIAGPLTAVLWWVLWRRAGLSGERGSLTWGLYVTAMSVVSLITAASALLAAGADLAAGTWQPRLAATGVVPAAPGGTLHFRLWSGRWAERSSGGGDTGCRHPFARGCRQRRSCRAPACL